MLIRFLVENVRSIAPPADLSLVAVDEYRPATRKFELLNEQLLTVAAIYGPNASGKSNVLGAIEWLVDAVGTSLRAWDGPIPIQPHKFGVHARRPSRFEIEMMAGGVRFGYQLELDGESVRHESLVHYPFRKPRQLFVRNGADLQFRRGLGALAGARELLTPRTVALSAVRRFEEPSISDFTDALLAISVLGGPPTRIRHLRRDLRDSEALFARIEQPSLFDDGSETSQRQAALSLLRLADNRIVDVLVENEERDERQGFPFGKWRPPRLVHRSGAERLPFEFAEESAGTQSWFELLGPTLTSLTNGSVLLFDEIDASLHPVLSARLVELFKDPDSNPHGAQLIFTSHDTSLLNHLNRDEVWLTDRRDAATELRALSDYGGEQVRKSLNLERAYLQGRFAALPEVDVPFVLPAGSRDRENT